jgi:predicted Zn-dependent protease
MRDWPHAIEAQQKATRRTPENIDRWETLADIYDGDGDRKYALEAHEHAVAISSKN